MKKRKTFVNGKKIGVIGLARSGIAAANLAHSMGAGVLVSEARQPAQCRRERVLLRKGIAVEFGGHSKRLLSCDFIIKSPGVPNHIPILEEIRKRKLPVWSEIEFALRFINCRRVVAITGTNGKTTTTALVGALFKKAGSKTVVCGNIGAPLASAVGKIDAKTTVVLEMSSYQLEDSPAFHAHISSVLNITPDHMEHHGTMRNYIAAKRNIFANAASADFCVLNYDEPLARRLGADCPAEVIYFSRKKTLKRGVYYCDNRFYVAVGGRRYSLVADLQIPGMHNIENALAAIAIADAAGIAPAVIEKTLASFKGVEHRIEFTAEIDGVRYYNDSKGTNVDSTRVALESFDRPLWLILGGRDKGSPYEPLRKLIKEKVRGVLLIGEASAKIKRELAGTAQFYDCKTMAGALSAARRHARAGEIVLLSPACASFDQFKDYEDRGRQFKKLVRAMK